MSVVESVDVSSEALRIKALEAENELLVEAVRHILWYAKNKPGGEDKDGSLVETLKKICDGVLEGMADTLESSRLLKAQASDSIKRQERTKAWNDFLSNFDVKQRYLLANYVAHEWTVSALEIKSKYFPDVHRFDATGNPKAG